MHISTKTWTSDKRLPKFIPDSHEELKAILRDANIPTLMTTLILYTGDINLFDSYSTPKNDTFNDLTCDIAGGQTELIRQKAFEVLVDLKNGKIPLASLPEEREFYKLLTFLLGTSVPENIRPLFWEEFRTAAKGKDARAIHWQKPNDPEKTDFKVLIIGSGASGLLSAIKLQEAGVDYLVVDKNPEIGGTWYETTYPGSGVDTISAFYSFSFENNPEWPRYYAQRNDVYRYWNHCADKYGIRPNLRMESSVEDMEWDEGKKVWRVTLLDLRTGAQEAITANAVFCGIGQLNRWKIPPFKDLDKFKGRAFHTADWQSDVDLTGKHVILIGTGATSMQLAPTIADQVKKLTIIQKSAQWIIGSPYYGVTVPDGEKYLLKNFPYFATFFRMLALFKGLDKFEELFVMDPQREDKINSASPYNDQVRLALTEYIKDKVGDDPELLSKLIPDYPPFGTRVLLDYGWIETLKKDNVELFTGQIEAFDENGIVTNEGRIDADIVLFATGYTPLKFTFGIRGIDGVPITDKKIWGNNPSEPRAHLGITVPGYPNLFLFYGPNTNIGAGCVPFNSELQVRYAMKSIQYLIENNIKAMDCKKEAHDKYNEYIDECLATLVYSHPKSKSWYNSGKNGRSSTNMPFSTFRYWELTKEPNFEDYKLIR